MLESPEESIETVKSTLNLKNSVQKISSPLRNILNSLSPMTDSKNVLELVNEQKTESASKMRRVAALVGKENEPSFDFNSPVNSRVKKKKRKSLTLSDTLESVDSPTVDLHKNRPFSLRQRNHDLSLDELSLASSVASSIDESSNSFVAKKLFRKKCKNATNVSLNDISYASSNGVDSLICSDTTNVFIKPFRVRKKATKEKMKDTSLMLEYGNGDLPTNDANTLLGSPSVNNALNSTGDSFNSSSGLTKATRPFTRKSKIHGDAFKEISFASSLSGMSKTSSIQRDSDSSFSSPLKQLKKKRKQQNETFPAIDYLSSNEAPSNDGSFDVSSSFIIPKKPFSGKFKSSEESFTDASLQLRLLKESRPCRRARNKKTYNVTFDNISFASSLGEEQEFSVHNCSNTDVLLKELREQTANENGASLGGTNSSSVTSDYIAEHQIQGDHSISDRKSLSLSNTISSTMNSSAVEEASFRVAYELPPNQSSAFNADVPRFSCNEPSDQLNFVATEKSYSEKEGLEYSRNMSNNSFTLHKKPFLAKQKSVLESFADVSYQGEKTLDIFGSFASDDNSKTDVLRKPFKKRQNETGLLNMSYMESLEVSSPALIDENMCEATSVQNLSYVSTKSSQKTQDTSSLSSKKNILSQINNTGLSVDIAQANQCGPFMRQKKNFNATFKEISFASTVCEKSLSEADVTEERSHDTNNSEASVSSDDETSETSTIQSDGMVEAENKHEKNSSITSNATTLEMTSEERSAVDSPCHLSASDRTNIAFNETCKENLEEDTLEQSLSIGSDIVNSQSINDRTVMPLLPQCPIPENPENKTQERLSQRLIEILANANNNVERRRALKDPQMYLSLLSNKPTPNAQPTVKKVSRPRKIRPKLYKPAPWANKRLYDFLRKKLEKEFRLEATLQAEKVVKKIYDTYTQVVHKDTYQKEAIQRLKISLATLHIIETTTDFFNLVREYLPKEFEYKVVPSIQPFTNVVWPPKDSNKNDSEPIIG